MPETKLKPHYGQKPPTNDNKLVGGSIASVVNTLGDSNFSMHALPGQFAAIRAFHGYRTAALRGMPLVVIEPKNAADESATIFNAFNQLQTYQADIPSLFTYNELLVIADGPEARMGTFTSGWEWFKTWRTVDGVRVSTG